MINSNFKCDIFYIRKFVSSVSSASKFSTAATTNFINKAADRHHARLCHTMTKETKSSITRSNKTEQGRINILECLPNFQTLRVLMPYAWGRSILVIHSTCPIWRSSNDPLTGLHDFIVLLPLERGLMSKKVKFIRQLKCFHNTIFVCWN